MVHNIQDLESKRSSKPIRTAAVTRPVISKGRALLLRWQQCEILADIITHSWSIGTWSFYPSYLELGPSLGSYQSENEEPDSLCTGEGLSIHGKVLPYVKTLQKTELADHNPARREMDHI